MTVKPPSLADYESFAKRRAEEQPDAGERPLVSIVTASFNAAPTLARTIRSVQAQSFRSIEQIFVDGGSNDGTLNIIRHFLRPQDYLLSERDRGISDAFNKGAALARGSFIQFLNADDWLSHGQLAHGVAALEETGADFVFGDLIFYEGDEAVFAYKGDPAYARAIHRRMPAIGHPTVLARRSGFERIGLFNPLYRNAMDYDWLLRLHLAGGRGHYCPKIVGHMTHAGVSNLEFARTIREVRDIAIAQGRNPFIAAAEARLRHMKTAAAQPLRRQARPLYELGRRLINPSYRPVAPHR